MTHSGSSKTPMEADARLLEQAAALARAVGTTGGTLGEQYHADAKALVELRAVLEGCAERVRKQISDMIEVLDLGASSPDEVFAALYRVPPTGGGAIGNDGRNVTSMPSRSAHAPATDH